MSDKAIYLHYGSATHHPMQTVRFNGTGSALQRLIREAKRERTPLCIQVGYDVEDAATFAKRVFGKRGKRR